MRKMISLAVMVFGTIGGWIGALMDHGNWIGLTSIALSFVGCFVGVWAGYKIGQYIGL
jgi:membrane protein DedA with SNARE-associated domain